MGNFFPVRELASRNIFLRNKAASKGKKAGTAVFDTRNEGQVEEQVMKLLIEGLN